MERGTVAVIGLCVLLGLWYGAGYLYNRRRGYALFRWLQPGLKALGGKREAGWLGSPATGARVNVIHARPPFQRLELTLLLARREVPLLWLLDHLRRRQDGLIIKATLRSSQRGELEVAPARNGILRRIGGTATPRQRSSWTLEEGPHELIAAYRGPGAQEQWAGLKPWLETYGAHLQRFSWQKQDPHVQLQMNASGLMATSSETFMADLQAAIGEATHMKK